MYNHKAFIQKLEYIHTNPVQEKCKLASVAEEYKYSLAKFYETGIDNWSFLTHYSGCLDRVAGDNTNNGVKR